MTIAGIIAEYNPLHNGHLWHMIQTRRVTGCDYIVCVLAGAFSQRGEAMIADKFARAEMALRAGADAVFELPALFAVRPADAFAFGGAAVLNQLRVEYLSFGCEIDDLTLLTRAAAIGLHEPEDVSRAIREKLSAGLSHARARGEAVAEALGIAPDLLNRPNCALAIEYLRALSALNSDIRPVLIRREGDYHALDALGRFPSASAVRRAITDGRAEEALACVPERARALLGARIPRGLSDMARLDAVLIHTLRAMTPEAIDRLPDAGEGLGHRIWACAQSVSDREALLCAVKCKRYTHARISRVLTYAMTGLTRELIAQNPMPYARLIGFRQDARPLIRELSARSGGDMITDVARLSGDPIFEHERRVTDLWGLSTQCGEYRRAGRERTQKFIAI